MTNNSFKHMLERRNSAVSGVPFCRHVLEAGNETATEAAALAVLELAQSDCLDREIPAAEICDALDFLAGRSDRAKIHCERFRVSLLEPDQATRFRATGDALTLIKRQFGA